MAEVAEKQKTAAKADNILELKGITKVFPGVKALDHVNFELRRGEIHALMGENGAGKINVHQGNYGSA